MESNIEDFVIKNGILKKYVGKASTIIIPDTVSVIGKGAFKGMHYGIKKIVIPDSVRIIGENAFKESFFGELEMGNNVEEIGESAFEDIHIGTEFKLSNKLIRIKDSAFKYFRIVNNCLNEHNLEIPNSVEEIGKHAFEMSEFSKIILPNSLKIIGEYAFSGTDEIKEIEIPTSLDKLPMGIFSRL